MGDIIVIISNISLQNLNNPQELVFLGERMPAREESAWKNHNVWLFLCFVSCFDLCLSFIFFSQIRSSRIGGLILILTFVVLP